MKTRLKYEMPQIDLIYLQSADIITTSTDAFDGEWVPIGSGTNDDLLM